MYASKRRRPQSNDEEKNSLLPTIIEMIVLAKQGSKKARHYCKYNSLSYFVLKQTRLVIS